MNTYTLRRVLWSNDQKDPHIIDEQIVDGALGASAQTGQKFHFGDRVGKFDWINVTTTGLITIDYIECEK